MYDITTVKPVYTGQQRDITKWPLLTSGLCSERQKLLITGQIKTGLCRQETTTRRCCYAHVRLYIPGKTLSEQPKT